MVRLIRGKIDNKIDNKMIDELIDLNFLVKNNKIEINNKTLTLTTVERLLSFIEGTDINIDFYFERWTNIENAISSDTNVEFVNFLSEKEINFEIINELKNLTETEKNEIALSLAKDIGDLKLLNEAMNKGTLTMNNFIKKMVVKYA